MANFNITYKEVLAHEFLVDAGTPEEAEEKFFKMLNNGEIDLSNGEVYDSSVETIPSEPDAAEEEYFVTYRIDGRFLALVRAKNAEDALKKAEDEYCAADFGCLRDVDGRAVMAEVVRNGVTECVWEA